MYGDVAAGSPSAPLSHSDSESQGIGNGPFRSNAFNQMRPCPPQNLRESEPATRVGGGNVSFLYYSLLDPLPRLKDPPSSL